MSDSVSVDPVPVRPPAYTDPVPVTPPDAEGDEAGPVWRPDPATAPLAELVEGLTATGRELVDEDVGLRHTVEAVAVRLPVEVDVHVQADGRVRLAGAPPTQTVKTTVMPVFHQMTLRVVRRREQPDQ